MLPVTYIKVSIIIHGASKKKMKKATREKLKQEKLQQFDNYNNTFTFNHLYASAEKCVLGVGWKASTQRYRTNMIMNVYETYKKLNEGNYKSLGFYEFDIYERGKPRHIKSVHISERVVQKCLCDYSLVPIIERSLIYDNGACMKHKGIDFSLNRLTCHLEKYYRKHGTRGYVLLFDFSKYFDNMNHDILKKMISHYYHDERLINLIYQFIDNCGERGLGLGSQISQICALMYPNKIDHYMKEVMHIRHYGRYMDDGYLIHESKEYLQKCLVELRRLCQELDIILNESKTQIVKITNGISYLKKKFLLLRSGRVVRKVDRFSITRMRRKLKSFKEKYKEGIMPREAIHTSIMSWQGHLVHYDAYRTRMNMLRLYHKLFPRETKPQKSKGKDSK